MSETREWVPLPYTVRTLFGRTKFVCEALVPDEPFGSKSGCGKSFKSEAEYEQHYRDRHLNPAPPPPRPPHPQGGR